jgi:hypothetical protein
MDYTNFSITIILGFFVLFFYILFLPKNKYVWGNIQNSQLRYIIGFSIILSAISYLVLWIRQVFYVQNEHPLFTSGNIIFLIGALLWPLCLHFFPTQFHTVILTLSISSLGIFLILIDECLDKSVVGIIFAVYLFFHVFFMDNIVWASFYRSIFPKNALNGWYP